MRKVEKGSKIEKTMLLDCKYRRSKNLSVSKTRTLGSRLLEAPLRGSCHRRGATERKLFVLCQRFRRVGESSAVVNASSHVHQSDKTSTEALPGEDNRSSDRKALCISHMMRPATQPVPVVAAIPHSLLLLISDGHCSHTQDQGLSSPASIRLSTRTCLANHLFGRYALFLYPIMHNF